MLKGVKNNPLLVS